MYNEFNNEEEFENFIKDKRCLIMYSAPWCVPCTNIIPYFRELSEIYTNFYFVKVNVDNLVNNPTNIHSIPTFYYYVNNTHLEQINGSNQEKLKEFIDGLQLI